MADKTNVPRLNMRYGRLYTSDEAGKKISEINIPEFDQKFLVMKAGDLLGDNKLSLAGSEIPIMADGSVLYPEQPLVALIASDYESATIAMRSISVSFSEESEEEEENLYQEDYGWGNIEDYRNGWKEVIKKEKTEEKAPQEEKSEETEHSSEDKEESETNKESEGENEEEQPEEKEEEEVIIHEYRKTETSFILKPVEYSSYTFFAATCWSEGANLHVMVPTQYPQFIADTVSSATGYERKKIVVHTSQYHESYDEYLLYPAIVAAIAANASLMLKCPVEIKTRAYNRRGGIRTKRITYLSPDLKPLAEEVVHTIDIGAYPMLEREVERQAMTGIIPSYPLQAFKASVKIEKSFSFPSFIFSSMGYSEAMAATEYHSSALAKEIGMNPYEFRLWAYKDKRKFTDYLPAIQMAEIKKLLTSIAMKSSFSRKWSANDLGRSNPSFLGYTKGIGLASAIGIAGFSTSFVSEHEYQAKMTATQRGAIVIDTSAYSRGTAVTFWKKLLKDELELTSEDSVLFSNAEHSSLDSGPRILSRFICSFSKQLQATARKLKALKETEKLPIAITFDVENRYFPCEFDESAFGAMAIELMLPDTSYIPVVKEVWADYSVGPIANSDILMTSVKQIILKCLDENGLKTDKNMSLHITFSRRDSDSIAAVTTLTRGLVISSLKSALEQAIGKKVSLPINAEEIFRLRRSANES